MKASPPRSWKICATRRTTASVMNNEKRIITSLMGEYYHFQLRVNAKPPFNSIP